MLTGSSERSDTRNVWWLALLHLFFFFFVFTENVGPVFLVV